MARRKKKQPEPEPELTAREQELALQEQVTQAVKRHNEKVRKALEKRLEA